ncbi:hypothetical protein N7527_010374 [Penicillium freii]|nr:hypothetical protein N7527_010374 [Penicillium freii]
MTFPRTWFDQEPSRECYERGSIITTDDGTQWEIRERLKQDDIQRPANSLISPSHATLKLRCVKANANPSERKTSQAFMRVYLQIPHVGSEFEDPETRAAQADRTFQPEELEAYTILSNHPTVSKFTPQLLGSKMSRQGPSDFVPGGFLIIVVWEHVEGLPLGDLTGNATGYWSLSECERAEGNILYRWYLALAYFSSSPSVEFHYRDFILGWIPLLRAEKGQALVWGFSAYI